MDAIKNKKLAEAMAKREEEKRLRQDFEKLPYGERMEAIYVRKQPEGNNNAA